MLNVPITKIVSTALAKTVSGPESDVQISTNAPPVLTTVPSSQHVPIQQDPLNVHVQKVTIQPTMVSHVKTLTNELIALQNVSTTCANHDGGYDCNCDAG